MLTNLEAQIRKEIEDIASVSGASVEGVVSGWDGVANHHWIHASINFEFKRGTLKELSDRAELYQKWFPGAPVALWRSAYFETKPQAPPAA